MTALAARIAAALPARYAGLLPVLATAGPTGAAAWLVLSWTGGDARA